MRQKYLKLGKYMCFSATSSFISSGFLIGVSAITIGLSKSRSYYMLAAIPLFFALQQAIEGTVWLTHSSLENSFLFNIATHIFLFFAFLVWPVWVPSSVLILEKSVAPQKKLIILTAIGFLLFLLGLYNLIIYLEAPKDSCIYAGDVRRMTRSVID